MMEKYSIDDKTLLLDLQNEEGRIMMEISQQLSDSLRANDDKLHELENRAKDVRYKIDSIMAKKQEETGVQD